MEASIGFGDDLIATSLAKSLHARGKRAAFGTNGRIIWGPWSEEIFRNNPNVARPGSEGSADLEWIPHHKGNRIYNRLDRIRNRWEWRYDFKATPGEIFFDPKEQEFGRGIEDFIFVEPNVPWHKSVAPNKDWGLENYQRVVDKLRAEGYDVVQSKYGQKKLRGVRFITTPTFRDVLALMRRARVALVPEGGLHHGAAAVGIPAVVLFGGFIPPDVVGYDTHANLIGGATEFCGSLNKCDHCRDAMAKISVEEVYQAVKQRLG